MKTQNPSESNRIGIIQNWTKTTLDRIQFNQTATTWPKQNLNEQKKEENIYMNKTQKFIHTRQDVHITRLCNCTIAAVSYVAIVFTSTIVNTH